MLKNFSIISIFFLSVLLVSAHDVLKTLSPELLGQVQQSLIDKGYLVKSEVKLGVYDEKTEEAFDRYQDDKVKAYMKEENEVNDVSKKEEVKDETFWDRICIFFKKIFGY